MQDSSGDMLVASLHSGQADRPLAVLIHGLTGTHDSSYIRATALALLAAGYPVLRLNLRGAGETAPVSRERYHAGRSQDLRDALSGLDPALLCNGLVLVGYSLGGNMLLKFLAEDSGGLPLRAGVSISAPIDLAASSRQFLKPRNFLYHRWLLARMQQETLDNPTLSGAERQAISESRSVYAFDDRFVAPRNGFQDAEDYYQQCSALGFLHRIGVPTLAIHAADDPWIPVAAYRDFDWAGNPALKFLLSPGGGHVGFHDGDATAWHDRCLLAFFNSLSD
ncbi:MAG: alpha/beta fold hydrolase [Alphaproteobacteria bacterium]|nr:alpha/beta fold hydrolase [Alphaproteobacteria bacterium]MBU0798941.1 alpha/beta fold hydrolase [Alphaproteobacteria bacterium]MBU0885678.1 alpha/beta fold hydrolase [Alphaproteobacteria bacterium]MBU1812666.1 alpha/beta fold hydrolase [Alphaproteobacteria bacterium]